MSEMYAIITYLMDSTINLNRNYEICIMYGLKNKQIAEFEKHIKYCVL